MNEQTEEQIMLDYQTLALEIGNAVLKQLMGKSLERFAKFMADFALAERPRFALRFETHLLTPDEFRTDKILAAEFVDEKEDDIEEEHF